MSLTTSPAKFVSLRRSDPATSSADHATTRQQQAIAQQQALELEQQWQETLIRATLRKHNEQARRNNRRLAATLKHINLIEGV